MKQQGDCNSCVSFAVLAAAASAVACGLLEDATSSSLSEQDFFFCRATSLGEERNCASTWSLSAGVAALMRLTSTGELPVLERCMPYSPSSMGEVKCLYDCKSVDPTLKGGTFKFVQLDEPWLVRVWRCGRLRAWARALQWPRRQPRTCGLHARARGKERWLSIPPDRQLRTVSQPPLRATLPLQVQQHIRLWGSALAALDVYSDFKPFFEANPSGVYPGPGTRRAEGRGRDRAAAAAPGLSGELVPPGWHGWAGPAGPPLVNPSLPHPMLRCQRHLHAQPRNPVSRL